MGLAWLGAGLLAELRQALGRPAVGDHPLDARQCLADTGDLAARLPAAAEHAERRRAFPGEVSRGYAAGGAGAELAELVSFDYARELGLLRVEENDDERRPGRQPRVGLDARQAELPVNRRHHSESA